MGNGGYTTGVPENHTYTYTNYYPDPLGRILSTAHSDFDHPVEYTYGSNANALKHTPRKSESGTYDPATLYLTTVTDGNKNQTLTYTDVRGRSVLTQHRSGTGSLLTSTYQTYDDRSRLTAVYPPLNEGEVVTDYNSYHYTYDGRDNLIAKTVPDQSRQQLFYDARDLLIATRRPGIPGDYASLATAYDGFGNALRTGFAYFDDDPKRVSLDDIAPDAILTQTRYGLADVGLMLPVRSEERLLDGPMPGLSLITHQEYDRYNRLLTTQSNNHLDPTNFEATDITLSYDLADNILRTTTEQSTVTGEAFTTVEEFAYDHVGRPSAQYHQITNDGIVGPRVQLIATQYTVRDEISKQRLGATGMPSNPFLQTLDFHYRPNGFLERINDPAALGSDLFGMRLDYDLDLTGSGAAPQLNGNISGMRVATASGVNNGFVYTYDDLNRLRSSNYLDYKDGTASDHYSTAYGYDDRGNLSTLIRQGRYGSAASPNFGQIDALDYTYKDNSNLLHRVTDDTGADGHAAGYTTKLSDADYSYDKRGNMTTNPGNGTTIKYNHLDLPYIFTSASGAQEKMVYTTTGRKVSELKLDAEGNQIQRREYLGAAQYLNGDLALVSHAAGRVVAAEGCPVRMTLSGRQVTDQSIAAGSILSTAQVRSPAEVQYTGEDKVELLPGFSVGRGASFLAEIAPCDEPLVAQLRYEYFLADHLGNNRITFSDLDGNGQIDPEIEVLQENHYYAFGLEMEGEWSDVNILSQQSRYRYNGKELNEDLGLYDYGARWYDPTIARFTTFDPLATEMPGWSPYNYTFGNPVNFTDPTGMIPAGLNQSDYDFGFAKLVQGNPEDFYSKSTGGSEKSISKSGGGNCPDCNLPVATVTAKRYADPLTANSPLNEYTSLNFTDQISSQKQRGLSKELNPFLNANEPIDGFTGIDLSVAVIGGFGINLGRICNGQNCNWYFSIFAGWGVGANAGVETGKVRWSTPGPHSNKEFAGAFINHDYGIGPFGYSQGGNLPAAGPGVNRLHDYGDQYTTGSIGTGTGPNLSLIKLRPKLSLSAMTKVGYTWVF